MREILVGKKTIAKKEYKYSILVQELWQEKKLICEEYGVKIRSELGESAILGITVSLTRIGELTQLLLRNRVTPISLSDVIEDWL
ncbi:MAG: hypothetical protein GXW99_11965 [Clostridiales bacterium]|nr:hypothetical protein [Clostridiales bacterium]